MRKRGALAIAVVSFFLLLVTSFFTSATAVAEPPPTPPLVSVNLADLALLHPLKHRVPAPDDDPATPRPPKKELSRSAPRQQLSPPRKTAPVTSHSTAPAHRPTTYSHSYTPVKTSGSIQAYARALAGSDAQYSCLAHIIERESGWNVHAANPEGAYGIPQALPGAKMSSAGSDWRNNPQTQIRWMLSYIANRYGTPCNAWRFWQGHSWY